MRNRHYLVLSTFAILGLVAGLHERVQPTDEAELENRRATGALIARYPQRPMHLYYRGLWALERQDDRVARGLFARAIESGFHSNEGLLHHYARLLVEAGAPQDEIDRAVALWQKHFPHSRNPDPREYRGGQQAPR